MLLIDIQLTCMIGSNGERTTGFIRQCFTGNQQAWKPSGYVFALSTQSKNVSLKKIYILNKKKSQISIYVYTGKNPT